MTMSQGKGRTLAPTRYAHDESSGAPPAARSPPAQALANADRKSTRLNSSHSQISYAVFCLKKKKKTYTHVTNIAYLRSTSSAAPSCIGAYDNESSRSRSVMTYEQ